MSKLFAVNEAYYGKTQTMIECEAILDRACKKIQSTDAPMIKETYNSFITVGKKLNRDLGLRSLSVILIGERGGAFTVPSAFPVIAPEDVDNIKRIDPSYVYGTIYVSDAFIRYTKCTGAELLAVILHEVGHLYSRSLDIILSRAAGLFAIGSPRFTKDIINFVMSQGVARFIIQIISRPLGKFNAWLRSLPIANQFVQFMNILDSYNPGIKIHKLFWQIAAFPTLPFSMLSNSFGGKAEIYADSFAASYGYGPELASALDKCETLPGKRSSQAALKGNPIYTFAQDYLRMTAYYYTWILNLEVHPSTMIRIMQTKEKLIRDLGKEGIDPAAKKAILADLRRIEDQIKRMTDSPEDQFNKTFKARYALNKMIADGTKGQKSLFQFYKLEDVQD